METMCRICSESIIQNSQSKPTTCDECCKVRYGNINHDPIADFELIEINKVHKYVLISERDRSEKISLVKSIDKVISCLIENYDTDLTRYVFCFRSRLDASWQVYFHHDDFEGGNRFRFAGANIEAAKENIRNIFLHSIK